MAVSCRPWSVKFEDVTMPVSILSSCYFALMQAVFFFFLPPSFSCVYARARARAHARVCVYVCVCVCVCVSFRMKRISDSTRFISNVEVTNQSV